MASSRFESLLRFVERRRKAVIAGVLVVAAAAGASLAGARFDNTLDMMLPAGSQAQRLLVFLRDATFSNKIVFSIEDASPRGNRDVLIEAADQLAALLKGPFITRVITGTDMGQAVTDAGFFMAAVPQILSSNDLASIDRQISPEGIDRLLRMQYLQLLKPEGSFLAKAIQSDPLDLNRKVTSRIEVLSANLGYSVTLDRGHFISADGRHAMVIAETSVPLTDSAAARRLLARVKDRIRLLPPSVKVLFVCGHTHTVSNEDTIKRDLGIIFTIAGLAFVALYVGYFRDPRALLIFAIPALAAVVGLAITSQVFGRLSYFVLAFGPVIAGIADDYGIAAYVAVRGSRDRIGAIRRIALPVLVGAVTTTAIFFAFFFSRIPGYYQLAWFCIISIFLSVALALIVLPVCVRADGLHEEERSAAPTGHGSRRSRMVVAAGFTIFLLAALALSTRLTFASDVTRLDGTRPDILATEAEFQQIWETPGERSAMLAVTGPDAESAMEAAEAVYRSVAARMGTNELVAFSLVWPSRKQRAENLRRWSEFWAAGREPRLAGLLTERGGAYGFTTNAFDPFFARLHGPTVLQDAPASNTLFTTIRERFVQKSRTGWHVLAYFKDTPENIRTVGEAAAGAPNAYLISRNNVAGILSDSLAREMIWTSAGAGLLIILTAFAFMRRPALVALAMVPAATGVLGLMGLMGALAIPLNVANLISGIVVFGLCMSFGIHMVHARSHHESKGVRTAIAFAAATTLIGAGVLMFAGHPALHAIGFTLVVGVGLGFAAALWVLPVLCSFLPEMREVDP